MIRNFIFGFVVGGLFLFLTLRQVDFSNCWTYMKDINYLWILLALIIYTFGFIVRSIRWKHLLSPLVIAPVSRLFSLLILGFFMNNLLPLRLGEFIRSYISGRKLNTTSSGVLATVVVERLFDGLSYICLFFITIIFLPFPEWSKKSIIAGSFLFIGCLIFLFFLVKHQELAKKIFTKLPFQSNFFKRLESIFLNFLNGLQIFSHGTILIKVFLLSITVWVIEGFVYYIFGIAFNLNLNIFQCFFIMVTIGIGVILPPAPGYVGTVEFLGVTALSFLGKDKNQAFAYIASLHLLQLFTIFILGIRSIIKEKITFQDIIKPVRKPNN